MALQIGTIKASRRKILPGLNVARYEASKDIAGRTIYRSKKLVKGQASAVGRYALQNKETVKRSARGTTGYQIGHEIGIQKGSFEEGSNLKKGILGMAEMASTGLSDEQMAKLYSMDEEKLSAMYRNNSFVFEVAFDYGGIDKTSSGAYRVSESKANDLQFVIQQYERYYGAL